MAANRCVISFGIYKNVVELIAMMSAGSVNILKSTDLHIFKTVNFIVCELYLKDRTLGIHLC